MQVHAAGDFAAEHPVAEWRLVKVFPVHVRGPYGPAPEDYFNSFKGQTKKARVLDDLTDPPSLHFGATGRRGKGSRTGTSLPIANSR